MCKWHDSSLSLLVFCVNYHLLGWNGEGFVYGSFRNASANVLSLLRGRKNFKMVNVWQAWHTRQDFPRIFGILTSKHLLHLVGYLLFLLCLVYFLIQRWMISHFVPAHVGPSTCLFPSPPYIIISILLFSGPWLISSVVCHCPWVPVSLYLWSFLFPLKWMMKCIIWNYSSEGFLLTIVP